MLPEFAHPQQLGYDLIVIAGMLLIVILVIAAFRQRRDRLERHRERSERLRRQPVRLTARDHAELAAHADAITAVTAPALSPVAAQAYAAGLTVLLGDAAYAARTEEWNREFAEARTAEQQRIDKAFERAMTRASRLGHLERTTWSWTRAEVTQLLEAGRGTG